jgi:AcrR family transcriptional regulator
MAVPSQPVTTDGRRLRSERTRQYIIEAYLALLSESTRVPTSAQIAERAGYSVRSLFERFPDLLTLSLAAADFSFAQANAQAAIRDADADRQTRIRSQVEIRGGTCERWLPLWRALNVNQHLSPELKQRLRYMRDAVVRRLELMYRPELATLGEADRRRLLIALEALTDFECWARMRFEHGMSIGEACAVWIRAIDSLLPPTPAVS